MVNIYLKHFGKANEFIQALIHYLHYPHMRIDTCIYELLDQPRYDIASKLVAITAYKLLCGILTTRFRIQTG